MSARLHAVVQDTDDLDEVGLRGAVEDHVHRLADRRFIAIVTAMAGVEAANARPQIRSRGGRAPLRGLGNPAQGSEDQGGVTVARFAPVSERTFIQKRGDIGSGRCR